MEDKEFRAFLDLIMVSDPWPLEGESQSLIEGLATREAESRGYPDWITAYHEFKAG